MATHSLKLPYLAITGSLIVAFGLVVAVLQPLWGEISALTEEREAQEAVQAQRQAFLQTLDRKKAELRVQAGREQELAVSLPEDQAVDDILRTIARLTDRVGLVVTRTSNQSDETVREYRAQVERGIATELPAGIVPLGATLTVQGSYAQFRAFLDQLERSPRLIDVASITMKRSDAEADGLTIDLRFTFYAYSTT